MIKCLLLVGILYFLCIGLGYQLTNYLNIHDFKYYGPFGFITLIAMCEVGYFPVQFFNLSFNFIIIWSFIILALMTYWTIKNIGIVINSLLHKGYFIILGCLVLWFVAFYLSSIDIEFSDSIMYLNDISQNINIDHLNLFNLYSGLVGQEWDTLYLYQGYYHFAAFFVWLVNIGYYVFNSNRSLATISTVIYGMGIIYNLVSSGFILDMLDSFTIKNKWVKYCLYIFTLLYTNFYYWKVSFAFYGNTYRSLLIWFILFLLVRYSKDKFNKSYLFLIQLFLFAGLAFSSSFFFISFELMICFMVYLVMIEKDNWIDDMALLVIPIVWYACVYFYKYIVSLGIGLTVIVVLYYVFRSSSIVIKVRNSIELFIIRYKKIIFLFIIPILLVVASYVFKKYVDPDYLYDVSYWLKDASTVDMVKDYRFMYGTWIDKLFNVVRWTGILILLFKYSHSNNYRIIRCMLFVMMFYFLSPLVTVIISRFIASNVYYRSLEIMFNPYSEAIYLLVVYECIKNTNISKVLSVGIIGVSLFANFSSFSGYDDSLYGYYIKNGTGLNKLVKISNDEYDIIEKFNLVVKQLPATDRQLTVISHAPSLRVFMPSVYQLFTTRDYFYPSVRVNNTFYNMATRHYSWIEYDDDLPYDSVCDLLHQYNVDYIILKYDPYYENYQFDQASDGCSITISKNDTYRIKQVVEDFPKLEDN